MACCCSRTTPVLPHNILPTHRSHSRWSPARSKRWPLQSSKAIPVCVVNGSHFSPSCSYYAGSRFFPTVLPLATGRISDPIPCTYRKPMDRPRSERMTSIGILDLIGHLSRIDYQPTCLENKTTTTPPFHKLFRNTLSNPLPTFSLNFTRFQKTTSSGVKTSPNGSMSRNSPSTNTALR